jgi:trk system potassium uptake protein TrkA
MGGGMAEALEGVTLSTSPLVGQNLSTLEPPEGVAICAMVRGDRVYFRRDSVVIQENDRVIFFALKASVPKVEQLFRVSLEYF